MCERFHVMPYIYSIDFIIYIPLIQSMIKPFDNCYVFYEIGQTMGICTPAGFTTSFG